MRKVCLFWELLKRQKVIEMEISQLEFYEYERIRQSGATNMFNVNQVCLLSKSLTREKCIQIMKEYSLLKEKYM